MDYPFLGDLCESRLLPSRISLKHWKLSKLRDLCYLYFLGLRVLLSDPDAKHWARNYCASAGDPNDFTAWRNNGNDLYAMLHALTDEQASEKLDLSPRIIRQWLRHVAVHDPEDDTRRLFMRLDSMFHISDSKLRALRRIVLDWEDANRRDREDTLTKLVQLIHTLAPSNSELLPELKKLAKIVDESASAGATGSANVAAVVGGLGAGFDPDAYEKGVYPKPRKPLVIRRQVSK
jgi:hypothetical protein